MIFFILACYITYPLVFKITSLATGYGDELFIAWVHSWNIHAFLAKPFDISYIFNAPMFFPYKDTLAYSETFLTNSLFMVLPVLILKEPIVANNITLILSLTLLGFFTYFLAFYLTKDFITSFIAGLLVEFCPVMLTYFVHIQMLASYLLPLAIIFFLKFLKTKKSFFLLLFFLIFLLQIYTSLLPSYFIFFSGIILTIFYIFSSKNYKWLLSKRNIFLGLLTFLLTLPIAIPYFSVSKEFNYTRDIRDSIHFAFQPEDFLTAIPQDRFYSLISKLPVNNNLPQNAEIKSAFLGVTFSIIFILSLIYFFKKKVKKNYEILGILISALLGLVLSLGPFLHIHRLTIHHPFPIPLPYAVFYYLMPGFQGLRNSQRWIIFFILFAAVFVGFTLYQFFKKSTYKKYVVCLILSILIIIEFKPPIPFFPMPSIKNAPKIYSWLNTTSKNTSLIEMPIYNWDMYPYVQAELWREYYSTLNFRNEVNGTSGFTPPPWQNMVVNLMANFPSDNTIQTLKNLECKSNYCSQSGI